MPGRKFQRGIVPLAILGVAFAIASLVGVTAVASNPDVQLSINSWAKARVKSWRDRGSPALRHAGKVAEENAVSEAYSKQKDQLGTLKAKVDAGQVELTTQEKQLYTDLTNSISRQSVLNKDQAQELADLLNKQPPSKPEAETTTRVLKPTVEKTDEGFTRTQTTLTLDSSNNVVNAVTVPLTTTVGPVEVKKTDEGTTTRAQTVYIKDPSGNVVDSFDINAPPPAVTGDNAVSAGQPATAQRPSLFEGPTVQLPSGSQISDAAGVGLTIASGPSGWFRAIGSAVSNALNPNAKKLPPKPVEQGPTVQLPSGSQISDAAGVGLTIASGPSGWFRAIGSAVSNALNPNAKKTTPAVSPAEPAAAGQGGASLASGGTKSLAGETVIPGKTKAEGDVILTTDANGNVIKREYQKYRIDGSRDPISSYIATTWNNIFNPVGSAPNQANTSGKPDAGAITPPVAATGANNTGPVNTTKLAKTETSPGGVSGFLLGFDHVQTDTYVVTDASGKQVDTYVKRFLVSANGNKTEDLVVEGIYNGLSYRGPVEQTTSFKAVTPAEPAEQPKADTASKTAPDYRGSGGVPPTGKYIPTYSNSVVDKNSQLVETGDNNFSPNLTDWATVTTHLEDKPHSYAIYDSSKQKNVATDFTGYRTDVFVKKGANGEVIDSWVTKYDVYPNGTVHERGLDTWVTNALDDFIGFVTGVIPIETPNK